MVVLYQYHIYSNVIVLYQYDIPGAASTLPGPVSQVIHVTFHQDMTNNVNSVYSVYSV